jgi:hypothetical protein
MVGVVNLVLNGAGLALDSKIFGGKNRNITFFDQETILNNQKANNNIITEDSGRIFYGIPFYHATPMSLSIEQNSKLCEQPVENGTLIAEHKVILPKRVVCSLAMPNFIAGRVINEIQQYYNSSKKIIIQCVAGTYMNMILDALPTEMDNSTVDRPIYKLSFREVILVEPADSEDNADASNNNTKKVSVFSDYLNNALPDGLMDFLGGF